MAGRKHYTREFKFEALELWRTNGKSAAQIERDLGLHKGQLRVWKRQLQRQGEPGLPGTRPPGRTRRRITALAPQE